MFEIDDANDLNSDWADLKIIGNQKKFDDYSRSVYPVVSEPIRALLGRSTVCKGKVDRAKDRE